MDTRGKDAPPGLDIDQDLGTQRRLWCAERIGQLAIAGLVLAALLGAFGPGLLVGSIRPAAGDGSVALEHPRRVYVSSPHVLRIVVPPAAAADARDLEVWVSSELFDAHELCEVVPEPTSVAFSGDGLTLRFARDPSGTPAPATVALHLEGRRAGELRARVAIPGHEPVELEQFVYP